MTNKLEDINELSITDILQAHDVLLSILLGKILTMNKEPQKVISHIKEIIDIQDINENAKKHITLLLSPLEEMLNENVAN
jgi:hypothetical protein